MEASLLTLRALHLAMVEDLRAHYLDRIATVAAYDPFPERAGPALQPLVTPAILLELEAIDPGEDDGTDRSPLRLTWAAHCILSARTTDQPLELREMAADVLAHCRHRCWGFPAAVRPPEAISAQPGVFEPGLDGIDSWLVRWEQVVHVGADCWAGGVTPHTVWLGLAPAIGAAHQADYWLLGSDGAGGP